MSTNIDRGLQNKFNRGEVSKEAFAREDVTPINNSCELLENFLPERLGPAMYRPGSELIDIAIDNEPVLVEFITSVDDPLLLIFGLGAGTPTVNVLRNDVLLTRTAVTSTMSNQLFDSALGTGWTDDDEGSATSAVDLTDDWVEMTGTGTDSAKIYQTLGSTQTGAAHAFKVQVVKGSVLFQLGTSGVDSADLFEGRLGIGIHHIEVTPDASLTVTISNDSKVVAHVTSCELLGAEAASVLLETALDASFVTSADYAKLRSLRSAQSADVMYFASKHFLPFKITRWNETSYSVERYENQYGPWEYINVSSITMNPTAPLDGDMEVVASKQFFDASSTFGFAKGTLIKLAVTGQAQTATGSDASVETNGVFVFGVGDARNFTIDIDTTGSYTEVRLEKSFDEITWQLVKAYTSGNDVVAEVYDDGLDGAEIYYRLQVEDIGAASTITLTITYDYGTIEAEGRIYALNSSTSVNVGWYVDLTIDQTTRDWYIGSWGGKNEYPSAIAFYEGRLWFAGFNKVWGSETDFYTSFDRTVEGASASIQRTIGFGSAEEILWLAPSARLVAGLATGEVDIKSTSFNEVLTDVNTNLKIGSDVGGAAVEPITLDGEVLFIQRGGNKLIALDFENDTKHGVTDFNTLNTSILDAGVVRMAYARNPETRVLMVMADGTVRILLREPVEEVLGWSRAEIQRVIGTGRFADSVLDVAVLPGSSGAEDRIYLACDVPGAPVITDLSNSSTNIFTLSAGAADVDGFKVNADQDTMFVLDATTGTIYEYSYFTPNQIDSIFYSGRSGTVSASATGFTVKPDGTRIWVVYGSVSIESYTLSVAWDASTIVADSVVVTNPDSVDVASPDMEEIYAIEWSLDGTSCYILGGGGADKTYIYDFTAATAFDIETLTLNGSFEVDDALAGGVTLAIAANGVDWYVTDPDDVSKIKVYANGTAWDMTTAVAGTSIDFDTHMSPLAVGPDYIQLAPGDAGFIWLDSTTTVIAGATASATIPTNYADVEAELTAGVLSTYMVGWGDSGTKLFILERDNSPLIGQVRCLDCSVAYDQSTATDSGDTLDTTAETSYNNFYGGCFKSDGTKYYQMGPSSILYQYGLTAWDISTGSYDTVSLDLTTLIAGMTAEEPWISSDGTKLFAVDTTTGIIWRFVMSTPWLLSSASYDANQNLPVSPAMVIDSRNGKWGSFAISADGTKITGVHNSDRIEHYTMSTAFDLTTATVDERYTWQISWHGSVVDSAVQVYNGDLTNVAYGSSNTSVYLFDQNGGARVWTLPNYTDDGMEVEYNRIIGTAWNSVSGTSPPASTLLVTNTGGMFVDSSGTHLFIVANSVIYQYTMSTPWDVDTISYVGVSGATASTSERIFISSDGTEVITCKAGVVYHYTMSAWDITTLAVVAGDTFNIGTIADDTFWMKDDGTVLFFVDGDTPLVTEYALSPAWDVSTMATNGNTLDITGIGNFGGYGTSMSADGTKLFITEYLGTNVDQPEIMYVYNLGTAWDVSTGVLDSSRQYQLVGTKDNSVRQAITYGSADGYYIFSWHSGSATTVQLSVHVWDTPAEATSSTEHKLYKSASGFTASTQGKLLKLAQTDEVAGGDISKHFDTFMQFASPGTTITLSANGGYAEGMTVGVWVDGVDDGDYTVDSSLQITGVTSGTNVIVGFRYIADYLSNKLTAYATAGVLNSRKRVLNTGLIMADYVPGALKVGPSLTRLGNLPALEDGTTPVKGDYDYFPFPHSGLSETDPRIAMRATGPCKIMALSYDVKDTSTKSKTSTTTVS